MTIFRHIVTWYKPLILGVISACTFPLYAAAQSTQSDVQLDAKELAEKILVLETTQSLTTPTEATDKNISLSQKKAELRKAFYFAMGRSDLDSMSSITNEYEVLIGSTSEGEADIITLYRSFAKLVDPTNPRANYEEKIELLDKFVSHEKWYIAFQAFAIKCLVETHSLNNNYAALQSANAAINLIPNELTPEAREARIQITDIVAYLHNLQSNTELAVENTARLVQLRVEADEAINGTELLNNLMYSFGNWRDHETRLFIAEVLLQIEDDAQNDTPGLTELRIAQVNAEIGNFEQSLKFAKIAIEKSTIETIGRSAKFQQAIAHAGLGNVPQAKTALSTIGPKRDSDQTYLLYANALIAVAENRDLDAVKLFTQRMDLAVQRLLKINNQDTTSLLAALENTRERQIEREKALLREAALREQKIRAQQRALLLLALLSAFLLIGLIAAIIFARYRDRISKELAIQTELAKDADRMKTEFLGMISHELRTPLNGIIGIADFLTNHNKDADVRQKSGIILKSGNILFRLIEAIIDMSRIDGGKLQLYPETAPLKQVLDKTARIWEAKAQKKNLAYTYFVSDDLDLRASFDEVRLTQCLNTLLSNAIKFTDQGRVHLHITGERSESGDLMLQAVVADTGMGIKDEVQAKLFKPFLQADSSMTRKHNGSGLRLAIARSLAEMMGGTVSMMSKAGRGSEFVFTAKLPIDEASISQAATETAPETITEERQEVPQLETAVPPAPALPDDVLDLMTPIESAGHEGLHRDTAAAATPALRQQTDPTDLRGLKVLIVEDLVSNQDIIKLLLAPQGIECVTADSGVTALELLEETHIDIILMDIRMPEMNGVEATQVIRGSESPYQHTPIIVLTADSEADTNAECLAAGADIFLTKPVMRRELVDAIIFLRQRDAKAQSNVA